MSRLDDELKIAFRRHEPSPDFTDRVLEQIARRPARKRSLWQQLVSMFQMPRVRWVAVGIAASLLVVIGSLQYRGDQQTGTAPKIAQAPSTEAPPTEPPAGADTVSVDPAPVEAAPVKHYASGRKPVRRSLHATRRKQDLRQKEGEAAAQRLMMALHIASETLNRAQRAVQADTNEPRPAPIENR